MGNKIFIPSVLLLFELPYSLMSSAAGAGLVLVVLYLFCETLPSDVDHVQDYGTAFWEAPECGPCLCNSTLCRGRKLGSTSAPPQTSYMRLSCKLFGHKRA